jgi:hypothetical protein
MIRKLVVFLMLCSLTTWANTRLTLFNQACTTSPHDPPPQTGSSDLAGYWTGVNIYHQNCQYQNDLKSFASKYGSIYQVSCTSDPTNSFPVADNTYNLGAQCSCDKEYENHVYVVVSDTCAQISGVTYFVFVFYSDCTF